MFRLKEDVEGRQRYKARLMVKCFQHVQNLDYSEVFSPVVKMNIVSCLNWFHEQMDVKTTFFHGDLEDEIYMLQPEGSSDFKNKSLVC